MHGAEFSHDEYRKIRDALPPYARVALVIAYHTGARKGEVRKIGKDKVDFRSARIDLPGRTTRNKTRRYLPIYGGMRAELDMALSATSADCPLPVQHEGKPVFDWKKSWRATCCEAKIPGTLFHAVFDPVHSTYSELPELTMNCHAAGPRRPHSPSAAPKPIEPITL
jgi:integrase